MKTLLILVFVGLVAVTAGVDYIAPQKQATTNATHTMANDAAAEYPRLVAAEDDCDDEGLGAVNNRGTYWCVRRDTGARVRLANIPNNR